jgi:glycosyltransferase involved in cell wall biosynthesis
LDLFRKKIVFIHQDGQITGSAISLKYLILGLNPELNKIDIIIGSEGPLKEFLEEIGVNVHVISFGTFVTAPTPWLFERDYYYNIRNLIKFNNKKLKSLLISLNPDIVHVNDKSALFAGCYSYKIGFKTVWSLRSSYIGKKSYLMYFYSKYAIRKHSNFLISISEDEMDGFENSNKIAIIHNSINLNDADAAIKKGSNLRIEFGISEDELVVCMIGNLNKQKGLFNFLQAASIISSQIRERKFRFIIVAPFSNDNRENCNNYKIASEYTKKLGISNCTNFTGRRSDIFNIMLGSDIVSACYSLNAIGRPGFEASAIGRPVIVNKGHSNRSSIVIHEYNGLVVEKDSPKSLAKAIERLAISRDEREKLGRNGFIHARGHFDYLINAHKVHEIYDKLLKI